MRILIAFVALHMFPSAHAAAQSTASSIQGFVVRTGTSSPITRAEVVLQPAGEDGREYTARTDGGGRFVLDRIAPGQYRLLSFREGYVDGEYGAVTEGDVGTILELESGEVRRDIVVSMMPTGVIAGTLLDQYGEPYVNATVEALEYRYQGPDRTLRTVRTATTNDRGEYRLFWLEPGEYVVRATPRGMAAGGGNMFHVTNVGGERLIFQSTGTSVTVNGDVQWVNAGRNAEVYGSDSSRLVPVYYPGTTDTALATPIDVAAGRDHSGYNLRMVEVRTVSVRGSVLSSAPDGFDGSAATVRLLRDTDVFVPGADEIMGRTGADGTFEIDGVAPGVYDLRAEMSGNVDGTQMSLYARERIEVGRADIDGLRIPLEPGAAISGRVDLGGIAGVSGSSVFVGLRSAGSGRSRIQNRGADADGRFAFDNLAPGDYEIVVTGLSEGTYVDRIRAGGFVLEDNVVRLGTDTVPDVDVSIRNDSGTVQVAVTDGLGVPVTGRRVQVVLVPDAARRQRADMFFTGEATDGRIVFEDVPPGSYQVFAWDGIPEGAWRNAEFMREFEDRGVPVTLSPLGTEIATVRVISASSNRR